MTESNAGSQRPAVTRILIRFAGLDRRAEGEAPTALLRKSQFFFARALLSASRGGFMFRWAMNRATVAGWPAPPPSERPAHRSSLKRCLASLGLCRVALRSTTSRHGASLMTCPIPFRSRSRKSKCSSVGSATFSTNCFPRPFEPIYWRVP